MKVWENLRTGGVDEAGVGELWPVVLWIGESLPKELLVTMNKGETLMGESVAGCTGEGGKGLGESEL